MSTEVTPAGTPTDPNRHRTVHSGNPVVDGPPAVDPDASPQFDEEKFRESLSRKNQENRSLRQQLREIEPKVAQFDGMVDELTTRAQDAESELRRLRAALAAGVPAEHRNPDLAITLARSYDLDRDLTLMIAHTLAQELKRALENGHDQPLRLPHFRTYPSDPRCPAGEGNSRIWKRQMRRHLLRREVLRGGSDD